MNTKSTFTVRFIAPKGKLKADGKAPILARIIVNGEMTHFSTKFNILPDRWDSEEGRTLHLTNEERDINAALDDYRALIRSRYNEMVFAGAVVTASGLKRTVFGLDEKSLNILDLCDKFITDYYKLVTSKSVTKCTYQRYVLTRERLAEYIKMNYKADDLPLADINYSFIKGFDLHNRTKHGSANNTASRFVKHFRTMFNLGLHNGWVQKDPLRR